MPKLRVPKLFSGPKCQNKGQPKLLVLQYTQWFSPQPCDCKSLALIEAKSLALEGWPWHKSSRPLIWLLPVFFLPNATNFMSLSLLSVSELVVASNAVLNSRGHLLTIHVRMLVRAEMVLFTWWMTLTLGVWGLGLEATALTLVLMVQCWPC